MAIVKFNNRKNSTNGRSANRLKRAIDYITDSNKTCDDLVGGNGVNKDNALNRMNVVKEYYNKCGGREYIHFVVSFKGQQNADIVYDIADRISMLYDEYQVLFAVHLNTQNTHIHFVVNTVCLTDGHKFSQSRSDVQKLKDRIENIINSAGLMYTDVYEEPSYFSYEEIEDDFGYEDEEEQELYEPMIFYEKSQLVEPMIFFGNRDAQNRE